MNHKCEAKGCTKDTKPDQLMCFYHWRLVPIALQRAVWNAWEKYGAFTDAHNKAKEAAINAVARKEGRL